MIHFLYGPGVSGGALGPKFFQNLSDPAWQEFVLPSEFLVSYWPDVQLALSSHAGLLPVTRVRGLSLAALRSIVLPEKFSYATKNGNLFEETVLSVGVTVTSVRQGFRNSYNWHYNQRLMPEESGPVPGSYRSSV